MYCKQVPKWDNKFWTADVYCQNVNNQLQGELSYLYSNGKKGKRARCQRDRERECVCERRRVAENRVSVHWENSHRRSTDHFGIILGSWETILIKDKDYKDTLRILKNIICRCFMTFGTMTFCRFPIMPPSINLWKQQSFRPCNVKGNVTDMVAQMSRHHRSVNRFEERLLIWCRGSWGWLHYPKDRLW